MKIKHILIAFILSSTVGVSSCDDVLDVQPEYAKERQDLFNTLEDYEFALTGAYARFRQSGYFSTNNNGPGSYSQMPDAMADNFVETGESLANYTVLTDWFYAADNSLIDQTWLATYSVVNQANVVLNNIDALATEDPQRVNSIKGQALAIRGFVHFDILRYWGVAFERNSGELGIPYVTTTDYEELPSRLTVKETYDRIFADLEQAEELLQDVNAPINTAASKSRIDLTAVRGILARVNLYAGNYTEAERYASLVIDAVPLASRETFPTIWTDASNAEVLWSIAFNAGEGSPAQNLYFASGNRNSYAPSSEVVEAYSENTDVRYPTYFREIAFRGTPRLVFSKYIGRGTARDNLVNFKVLRVAEMYLIRAEARARAGSNAAGASQDLNTLRAARISNYVPVVLTGQPLLNAIELERRKELIGEGHRWFDLKRTTRNLVRVDCSAPDEASCTLPPDAREWVWPIPQSEIIANPNLAGQQSPNYGS